MYGEGIHSPVGGEWRHRVGPEATSGKRIEAVGTNETQPFTYIRSIVLFLEIGWMPKGTIPFFSFPFPSRLAPVLSLSSLSSHLPRPLPQNMAIYVSQGWCGIVAKKA